MKKVSIDVVQYRKASFSAQKLPTEILKFGLMDDEKEKPWKIR